MLFSNPTSTWYWRRHAHHRAPSWTHLAVHLEPVHNTRLPTDIGNEPINIFDVGVFVTDSSTTHARTCTMHSHTLNNSETKAAAQYLALSRTIKKNRLAPKDVRQLVLQGKPDRMVDSDCVSKDNDSSLSAPAARTDDSLPESHMYTTTASRSRLALSEREDCLVFAAAFSRYGLVDFAKTRI